MKLELSPRFHASLPLVLLLKELLQGLAISEPG